MKLFNYLVTSILLFTSLNVVRGQGISSENLVNIHNLSTSQISGLASPARGSLVYNTDSNKLFVFDGSIWMATATVDTTSLSNRIDQRVRYSDTAAMLIGYVKKGDTSSMLAPFLRKVDTSSLSDRINLKLSISDTASMLLPYTRSANAMKYTDTSSMLVPYLRKVDTSGLSSRINLKLSISDTASMLLPYTRSTNAMKYTDTAAMLVPYLRNADTTAMLGNYLNVASNGLTKSGKTVQLGGNLTSATTITNNSNTLTIATGGSAVNLTGLTSGALTDSLLTVSASTGRINRIASSQLNKADSTTASNGLTLTGKDVRLGGNLSAATTITNNSNTLTIATGGSAVNLTGLTSGALTDSLLTVNASTGRINRIASSQLNKADSTTASNGLTLTGKDVRLGGNLSAATTITNNSNTLTIATGGSAVNFTGLTSGALTDSLLTVNASTGRINRIASSQLNKADSTTASNGLTLTGKDVSLGGSLTSATSITTTGTNTLSIVGLQSATTNDSVLMITSGNVLRKINATSVAKEPFNVVGGSVQATSNTQNIYTQGNVSVGKTTNAATLDVGGKVKADSTISAPNFVATVQALSSGSTVSWNVHLGANASVTLNTNATLSITNVSAGMYGLIRVSQDGTGGRSITLPSGSKVINGGGAAVSLTQTANAVDILTFYYDGSNYWWTIGNNYN